MSDSPVTADITIDAPAATVFAILADPHRHPEIDGSGSVKSTTTGPHHMTEGDEFRVDMKLFGVPYSITNRVVEYEQDRLIAWRHTNPARWRYELRPEGERTHVTETWDDGDVSPLTRAFFRLTGTDKRNRAGIEATLPRLKAAAEADEHKAR